MKLGSQDAGNHAHGMVFSLGRKKSFYTRKSYLVHFYTNVQKYRDFILARGIKNGEKYVKRLKYEPTLYIPTNKFMNSINVLKANE